MKCTAMICLLLHLLLKLNAIEIKCNCQGKETSCDLFCAMLANSTEPIPIFKNIPNVTFSLSKEMQNPASKPIKTFPVIITSSINALESDLSRIASENSKSNYLKRYTSIKSIVPGEYLSSAMIRNIVSNQVNMNMNKNVSENIKMKDLCDFMSWINSFQNSLISISKEKMDAIEKIKVQLFKIYKLKKLQCKVDTKNIGSSIHHSDIFSRILNYQSSISSIMPKTEIKTITSDKTTKSDIKYDHISFSKVTICKTITPMVTMLQTEYPTFSFLTQTEYSTKYDKQTILNDEPKPEDYYTSEKMKQLNNTTQKDTEVFYRLITKTIHSMFTPKLTYLVIEEPKTSFLTTTETFIHTPMHTELFQKYQRNNLNRLNIEDNIEMNHRIVKSDLKNNAIITNISNETSCYDEVNNKKSENFPDEKESINDEEERKENEYIETKASNLFSRGLKNLNRNDLVNDSDELKLQTLPKNFGKINAEKIYRSNDHCEDEKRSTIKQKKELTINRTDVTFDSLNQKSDEASTTAKAKISSKTQKEEKTVASEKITTRIYTKQNTTTLTKTKAITTTIEHTTEKTKTKNFTKKKTKTVEELLTKTSTVKKIESLNSGNDVHDNGFSKLKSLLNIRTDISSQTKETTTTETTSTKMDPVILSSFKSLKDMLQLESQIKETTSTETTSTKMDPVILSSFKSLKDMLQSEINARIKNDEEKRKNEETLMQFQKSILKLINERNKPDLSTHISKDVQVTKTENTVLPSSSENAEETETVFITKSILPEDVKDNMNNSDKQSYDNEDFEENSIEPAISKNSFNKMSSVVGLKECETINTPQKPIVSDTNDQADKSLIDKILDKGKEVYNKIINTKKEDLEVKNMSDIVKTVTELKYKPVLITKKEISTQIEFITKNITQTVTKEKIQPYLSSSVSLNITELLDLIESQRDENVVINSDISNETFKSHSGSIGTGKDKDNLNTKSHYVVEISITTTSTKIISDQTQVEQSKSSEISTTHEIFKTIESSQNDVSSRILVQSNKNESKPANISSSQTIIDDSTQEIHSTKTKICPTTIESQSPKISTVTITNHKDDEVTIKDVDIKHINKSNIPVIKSDAIQDNNLQYSSNISIHDNDNYSISVSKIKNEKFTNLSKDIVTTNIPVSIDKKYFKDLENIADFQTSSSNKTQITTSLNETIEMPVNSKKTQTYQDKISSIDNDLSFTEIITKTEIPKDFFNKTLLKSIIIEELLKNENFANAESISTLLHTNVQRNEEVNNLSTILHSSNVSESKILSQKNKIVNSNISFDISDTNEIHFSESNIKSQEIKDSKLGNLKKIVTQTKTVITNERQKSNMDKEDLSHYHKIQPNFTHENLTVNRPSIISVIQITQKLPKIRKTVTNTVYQTIQ